MRIWRSLLFVPANQRRMLDKLNSLPADGFIFDLEDTVPAAEKANARAMAKETIAKTPGDRSWVRVNAVPSGFLHEDLAELAGTPGLAGFVVPKQDTPGDVAAVDRMLSSIEVRKGLAAGSTPIIVMIESALGVLSSLQIITAAKRVESVIYAGGEDGDMNVSLGATWSSEGPEMMFVRQFTFVAARAADVIEDRTLCLLAQRLRNVAPARFGDELREPDGDVFMLGCCVQLFFSSRGEFQQSVHRPGRFRSSIDLTSARMLLAVFAIATSTSLPSTVVLAVPRARASSNACNTRVA